MPSDEVRRRQQGIVVGADISLPPRTSDDVSSPSSWLPSLFLPSRPGRADRNPLPRIVLHYHYRHYEHASPPLVRGDDGDHGDGNDVYEDDDVDVDSTNASLFSTTTHAATEHSWQGSTTPATHHTRTQHARTSAGSLFPLVSLCLLRFDFAPVPFSSLRRRQVLFTRDYPGETRERHWRERVEEAGDTRAHAQGLRSAVRSGRFLLRGDFSRERDPLDRDLKSTERTPSISTVGPWIPRCTRVLLARELSRTARSLVHSFTRSPARLGVVTHRRSVSLRLSSPTPSPSLSPPLSCVPLPCLALSRSLSIPFFFDSLCFTPSHSISLRPPLGPPSLSSYRPFFPSFSPPPWPVTLFLHTRHGTGSHRIYAPCKHTRRAYSADFGNDMPKLGTGTAADTATATFGRVRGEKKERTGLGI